MRHFVTTLLTGAGFAGPVLAQQGDACRTANTVVNLGWDRFREGNLSGARDLFAQALDACPTHIGAMVG